MLNTGTIDELCDIEYGTRVVKKNEKGTEYPVFGGGGESFRIDKFNRCDRLIVARFGMSLKCTRYVSGKFFLNDSGLTLCPKNKNLSQPYLDKLILNLNNQIYSLGSGSAQKNLRMDKFRLLNISYPSLLEQQRIVAKIDTAFAEINRLKEISNKTGSIYSQLLKKIIFQCLNNKNYNWTNKYLNEISTDLDSKRKPITKSKRIKGLTPYYGASGIVDYVQGYIFDDELLLISEDGANLISRSYPIAFSINGRSWVNNHAHVLKFNSKDMQSWVEIYLNYKNIDDFISGMAQPKLNKAKLNQIPIPIPEESKLKEIIKTIVNAKEIVKKGDINLITKSELLDNLKSSILRKELNMNL